LEEELKYELLEKYRGYPWVQMDSWKFRGLEYFNMSEHFLEGGDLLFKKFGGWEYFSNVEKIFGEANWIFEDPRCNLGFADLYL
jgi:hypothetical protein